MKHTLNSLEAPEDTCECTEEKPIAFLDTSLMVRNNKISLDLNKKEEDHNHSILNKTF